MQALFDYLAKRGLTPRASGRLVARWNARAVNNFTEQVQELVRTHWAPTASPFTFVANSQLSGAAMPCASPECRVRHADRLARFATLYADKVVIQNPFTERRPASSETLDWDRGIVFGALQVLWHLKPIMDAGLITLTNPATAFCDEHAPEIVKSGRLERLHAELHRQYSQELRITVDKKQDGSYNIDGPPNLLEHPIASVIVEKGAERLPAGSEITKEERERLVESIIRPILSDIVHQHVLGASHEMRYLTDRDVDFAALSAVTDPGLAEISRAVTEGLSHSVPTLEQVSLKDLLQLRREEGETFTVYRDAVGRVLRSIQPADAPHVKQAFQDLVLPELNKIDAIVFNLQKRLRKSTATDLLFGLGVVTVGLFSGILTPEAGKLIAQFGGVGFGVKALRRLHDLQSEPDVARDSPYYFLWKAREHARHRSS